MTNEEKLEITRLRKQGKGYKAISALEKLKQNRLEQLKRAEAISAFMFELHERDNLVEEFTTEFWNSMIEIATVHQDGSIVFKFKNGKEVTR